MNLHNVFALLHADGGDGQLQAHQALPFLLNNTLHTAGDVVVIGHVSERAVIGAAVLDLSPACILAALLELT